ncbi:TSC22 domain family protein 2-like isoform X2 [Leuresthes tenuis]|uniref:TSC22 domain family protein 2-like isoform X2 n=1 Tax=Leuresthes tenuis TaxID=355514 RepID=UPI003B5086B8
MSKMPAKKKSCFQITSVTQAQVAAIGAADDTESLDDPDESRTEDVSSEIYDMSRADYEPACDRSSSEEALNNVGEPAEAVSVTAPSNVPQASQLPPLLSNPAGELRKVGVSGSSQGAQPLLGIGITSVVPPINQPGGVQQQPPPAGSAGPSGVSVNTSLPAAVTGPTPPPATSTVSCSSRFRVIKLDHGTGEPFRRGRWTCTEFYEKDSEASLAGRTADSIRHASVTLDPAADRDSGLGLTGGSVVSPATHASLGLGSTADACHSSTRMISVETLPQQQILHQNYSASQHSVSSSATHSSFSGMKPTAVPAQSTIGGSQPPATQNVLPVGQNGLPQSGVHIQKSPIMPPSAQPIAYPHQQQVPVGHQLTSQSSGLMQNQTEYYQQQQSTPMPPGHATGQSLPAGPQSAGQGPMPPSSGAASVPSQVGDAVGAGGGSASAGQPAPAVLQQQTMGQGATGGSMLVGGSTITQQTVSQYAAAGKPHPHGHPATCGVQNVPAIAMSSSAPASVPTAVLSASSAAMPNVTTSSFPPGQITHSKTPVALGVQGLPATGFGMMEAGGGMKLGGMVNAQSPVVSGREPVKPFMPETLQLTTPTVNSLFGIHIPVDGEEDSASGTNIVAIDNKIEQAMDLVKSHLMYAVREEVEVLKEQIKELYERNSVLERENAVLKSLANSEQLSQLSAQSAATSGATPPQQGLSQPQPQPQPQQQSHPQLQHHPKPQQLQTQLDPGKQLQPNVTSA